MKLSAPKNITFIVSLILAVVGILLAFGVLSFLSAQVGIVLLLVGFALLAFAVLLKDL